jgi:bifunctional DNA-binding transcriptional regulator/antitoxin component of YhaV-PrlF toxin-antitoxin module
MTERGQISIPARIRKLLHLKPGQKLRWRFIAPSECRVFIEPALENASPFAALGYIHKLYPQDFRSSDERMDELRSGAKVK